MSVSAVEVSVRFVGFTQLPQMGGLIDGYWMLYTVVYVP